MSVTWGDYNRDGWMDLYVSNMESSAGKRITYQRHFRAESSDASRAWYRRHARGNTLFRGGADGRFEDVSEEAAVTSALWAWGSLFCDVNLDGALDLLAPNGFVTNERSDDL